MWKIICEKERMITVRYLEGRVLLGWLGREGELLERLQKNLPFWSSPTFFLEGPDSIHGGTTSFWDSRLLLILFLSGTFPPAIPLPLFCLANFHSSFRTTVVIAGIIIIAATYIGHFPSACHCG